MSIKNSEDKNQKDSDQDIVYEDNDFDVNEADKKVKKLKKELKKTRAEKDEYLMGWQRAQADYSNLKKRSEEEKNAIRKYGSEEIILDILKVVDSFEMAFKDKEAWSKAPENWRVGVEFIYNQLKSVLDKNNVIIINPIGELFDPNIHHCVEVVKTETEKDDGLVVEVIQKGYLLGEKNIRPAMVKVGKFEN